MKRFVMVALVAACFLGLSACACGTPPTLEWQPVPTFRKYDTTPTRTITVPYQSPGVQFTAPAATYSAPCS